MKKLVLFLVLLMLPTFVLGEDCDYTKQVEYGKLANNITYETKYSKSDKTFTITFYNVISVMYLAKGNEVYFGNGDSQVTFKSVAQGTDFSVQVKSILSGCSSPLTAFHISIPYFNPYYGTEDCEEYKTKLNVCASQFLSYQIDEELFNQTIENYKNAYTEEEKKDDNTNTGKTFLENLKDFSLDWGVPILIVLVVSAIAVLPFKAIISKIKHRI